MKKMLITIIILFTLGFAQEAKIDSIVIQTKIAELELRQKQIVEAANLEIGQINYTIFVLNEMLKPKIKLKTK